MRAIIAGFTAGPNQLNGEGMFSGAIIWLVLAKTN